jgi:hypothetical protein
MKLDRTLPPDEGALTVVFGCPGCGAKTALLINPMETQMVRSLGVQIGGGSAPAGPMGMVLESLEAAGRPAAAASGEEPSAPPPGMTGGSKCPFTGVVADALARSTPDPAWTAAAEERMARVPPAVQVMARKGIEIHARQQGYLEITEDVIDEVKARFGL